MGWISLFGAQLPTQSPQMQFWGLKAPANDISNRVQHSQVNFLKKSLPGNLSEFSGVQQSNFPAFPAEKKLKWFSDFYHLITRLKYQIILKNCLCDNKRKRKTLHFTWQTTNWWSCSKGRKSRKSFIFIRTTRRETLFKIWLCFLLDFPSVNIPYKDE